MTRMRNTRGHAGNRRSHHALKELRLSSCPQCKELYLRHRACQNCGTYKGREVIDVMKKIVKKEKKNQERKDAQKPQETEKKEKEENLDIEKLSNK